MNWGDGTPDNSFQISSQGSLGLQSHAYQLPGSYQVTVTVTDIYGLSGSESFTTTVAPVAPSPAIESAPASMNAGSSVTLVSSVADQSLAENAAGYAYAWSVLFDGSPYTLPGKPSLSGPTLVFSPTLGGTYTIGLAATDASGSVGVAPTQRIVVNDLNTTTSVASSANPSVSGQSVTFTATVSASALGSNPAAYPTGTVTFYNNGVSIGTGTLSGTATDTATFTTNTLSTATHSITAQYTSGDGTFSASPISASISQAVNKANTTTTVTVSASSPAFGQQVTFNGTVTVNSPGSTAAASYSGSVDFYDTTTMTDLGSVALSSSGTAALSTSSLPPGSNTITATYSGNANLNTSSGTTTSLIANASIIVLDPSACGALSLSGNADIKIPGFVAVDSSSTTALSASGNASVTASSIQVVGKVQQSGNARFSPAPKTGAAAVANPLAAVASPGTSGLTKYGSESLSGNSSATIKSGIYSQITLSGNATLTLSAGIYVIEGGGLTVSGNANICGSGVMIVNAGSDYPNTGGTYGSISLSGNGTYSLTPPTSGTYTGIVILQPKDNTKALSLSGNASGMTGAVCAPAAQLTESGNAQLNASLVVDLLTISGNGITNGLILQSQQGTVAFSPAQIRSAYGLSDVALDGSGQTIAIVDAYDDPDIFAALDAFDTQFGLTTSGPSLYEQFGPASSFLTVLNQNGQGVLLPGTDPNGPGSDNWETEESLDVEWAHAIAPGARIILVEANSPSLPDLMTAVATAASQPGVSVVSMSWGFAEGQDVFASDEAAYDPVFTRPGVTFVASTGDYGAADPEYPAFSPNVLAVGGTTLTLNADNSYSSEIGFGYESSSFGSFIGSGGGISIHEPEPAYQQGVQSTGSRTIPDVSFVADPATGAWVADPYNVPGDNPFEVVGGTSLSAPCWAGLLALVDQGRASAGEPALNSSSPTEVQQALYSLPQNDYNDISSGYNGYTAAAGYNLVTGLGTPVANLLVPDLIAYQGPGTTYAGPTVAPMQSSELVNTGAVVSSPINAFSIFDSLTISSQPMGQAPARRAAWTNRPGLALSASRPGALTIRLNIASFPANNGLLSEAGDHLSVLPSDAAIAGRLDEGSQDFASPNDSTLVQTPAESEYVKNGVRRNSLAPPARTSRAMRTRPAHNLDARGVDALLSQGWSARAAFISDRPRQENKPCF